MDSRRIIGDPRISPSRFAEDRGSSPSAIGVLPKAQTQQDPQTPPVVNTARKMFREQSPKILSIEGQTYKFVAIHQPFLYEFAPFVAKPDSDRNPKSAFCLSLMLNMLTQCVP